MENQKNNLTQIDDLVNQKLLLNRAERNKKGAPYTPLTSVSTGAPELKKQFDYIEKWTGEATYLTTPIDRINDNYIKAQYLEGKKNAADQGFWGELGGFLAQSVAGEIVLGTVSGVGYLLDVQHWGSQLMGGEGDYGNWLSNYMEEGQQWIREAAPIHQDPDNLGRSTWQNMLHGDGWWAQNGVSVASSLSILIPVAGWTRGVSLVGKGINAASQGARIGKWGTTAAKATKTVDKVMDIFPMTGEASKLAIDGIHKATVSRLIESQMEATAVFKEKYDYYMAQEHMSEEEARQAAGEAAAFTYNWNWGALLTDIPQYMLLGGTGSRLKSMLHSKKPGFIQNSNLLNKTKGIRNVATTMFSEGLEESYQYIIAEEGKRMGDIQAGLVDPNDTTLKERLSKYSEEADLYTAALFGAFGGGVFKAAGPKATQLINKSFRKGEMAMTEKDLRANEAKDRFTRLAHSMDMVNQATKTGDEEAVFTAKSNMAFDIAKQAVAANNWNQARSAIAQLRNATPEEKEAYDIKENFGEFVENIDEWITHMDAAANIVERAKFKYTYGLADAVARRQFDKYMYDVQAPKLREKINSEMKNVIPNFNAVSQDGNRAIEEKINSLGMIKALDNLEKLAKTAAMPQEDKVVMLEQIMQGREYIKQRKESFDLIQEANALSKEDKLALSAIEGGTADDLISLAAKEKLMNFHNEKNIINLNYLTSRDGRREFKKARAKAYKEIKSNEKTKKDKEKERSSMEEAADSSNISKAQTNRKDIQELNLSDVAKAIANGASYEQFVDEKDVLALKKAIADFNQRNEADPSILKEEGEDMILLEEDELSFDEDIESEKINVLDVEATEEAEDILVNANEDLAKELEAAESHEEIEIPVNNKELNVFRITDTYEETLLSKIPGQLAWLSSNNPQAEEITPEMKALSAFLETPDSSITDLEVEFDFNKEWIKNNPSELYTRMMKQLSQGIMPDNKDIGFMPIQATFIQNGRPVEFQGFTMRMNLHNPSFFFKKDGSPKYNGISEYQAKIAILHKKAIVQQMLNGNTVIAKVNGKSKGSIINESDEEGEFATKYVFQTLKRTVDKVNFLVGDKTGRYVTHDKKPRLSLGAQATPGAIYTEVSTANGSKFPLRLHVNNLSTSEANLIHAIYVDLLANPDLINNTISDGIIKYINSASDKRISDMKNYLPELEEMTYQELLSHLVYEGSRTIAHKYSTLTHFVNVEKGGLKLPNVVQFGSTKMPLERLEHETGKAEFINWLIANKRRQVDANRLGTTEYKAYLNDTKVLTTNIVTTPEGNIFIQPVVSYSTNMRVLRPDITKEKEIPKEKKSPSTQDKKVAAETLKTLKEDLEFELTNEFGNKENATVIQEEIKKLEEVSEIFSSVNDTIEMFQKGVKLENNEQIVVNLPENDDFEENPC